MGDFETLFRPKEQNFDDVFISEERDLNLPSWSRYHYIFRDPQDRMVLDTVEVWGSSPHVPTIFLNRLAMLGVFFVAPKRSISGLSSCFFKAIP